MFEFLLAVQNQPFAIALALMVLIALMEGVGMLVGVGIFSFLDSIIPEFGVDLDADAVDMSGIDSLSDINAPEATSPHALSRFLGWLRIGRVPILILFIIFLTSFGLVGYFMQALVGNVLGVLMPALLAGGLAFAVSLPLLRVSAMALERVMPQEETSAVSQETFIGKTVEITIGTATQELQAEARLTDQYGQAHYIFVKPEEGLQDVSAGVPLLVVRKEGDVFIVIEDKDSTQLD